ncbi:hypothetical protein BH11VER1_BH11VER1_01950 [soil metagenome]
MNLIYLDESGNSGRNLGDPQQPVFVLGALIVPESKWLDVELAIEKAIAPELARIGGTAFEIHATELRNGTGYFKDQPLAGRIALRDKLLDIAIKHKLQFVYRAITKKRYSRWLEETYGRGVIINPHLAAFPLVVQIVNNHLRSLGDKELGILIIDENREVVGDLEQTVKLLRADRGVLQLDRIIEKGFFIDSKKSLILQLADLCTYQARKQEERKLGLTSSKVDDGGIARVDKLVLRGNEAMSDVLRWLASQNKGSGEAPQRDAGR